jgi:hypothetical protein
MDSTARENTAARIYCAAFTALRDCGVGYQLADEVSQILERETFIGISYERTSDEQETINKVLPFLISNH